MRPTATRVLIGALLWGLGIAVPAPASEIEPARLDQGILQIDRPTAVIARFERVIPYDLTGLTVHHRFRAVPAVYATATPEGVRALASRDDLAYLEADKPIELNLDTATVASQARDVFDPSFDPSTPALDKDGATIDGSGVGIAVVDSGLDGLHPDFQVAGKVGGNWIVTPAGLVPSPYTNEGAAHGTHVAGIAAGTGASDNRYRGAAPGATLYSFAVAPGGTVAFASIAFEWILENWDDVTPNIRVVNNSWGCGTPVCRQFNPNQMHNVLASKLADTGKVTVVFAAGNDAGDGGIATTNGEIHNPTSGIVGVANYSDDDRKLRDFCISGTSSRGAGTDPRTWPDVAAPGERILSTYALGPDQNTRRPDGLNTYRQLSGTSMAAPHVAGIAALLTQANPALTPAEIEYLLKDTATLVLRSQNCRAMPDYVRADPSHPWTPANYVAGHGLVDAYAATQRALAFSGIPSVSEPLEPIPDSFIPYRKSVEVTGPTLYLHGDGTLDETRPATPAAVPRPLLADEGASFVSAPFTADTAVSGLVIDAWIGTIAETPGATVLLPRLTAEVSIVDTTGEARLIARDNTYGSFIAPIQPFHREFVLSMPSDSEVGEDPFPEEAVVGAGEKLKVAIIPRPTTSSANDARGPFATVVLYHDGTAAPARVRLGAATDAAPGTDAYCTWQRSCVDVGGDIQNGALICGQWEMEVSWTGPQGSGVSLVCNGWHIACVVADAPEGSCSGRALGRGVYTNNAGYCTVIPAGSPGTGRCRSMQLTEDDR